MSLQLRREDYTVGWVCALPIELAAAQEMLDEEHETPQIDAHDTNIYTCGRVGEHNVVIACLPEGQLGTNSAAAVAVQMKSTFTSTRFGLMVGIGGGVPSDKADSPGEDADIRLGDVVVGKPCGARGGVVQFDFGKATPSGFERTGFLNAPPTILLNAVTKLRAEHIRGRCKLLEYLSKLHSLLQFRREAAGPDALFKAKYDHEGGATCCECSEDYLVARKPRSQEVVVHYGTIASGNQVMRNAIERDRVSAELGGVLCFEMEAAGLMNSFPCLVIRGICDYADSHKNKRWQAYAAGTASAYAKELLSVIPPTVVARSHTVEEAIRGASVEWSNEERKCMHALRISSSDYEQFKNRNPKRVERTCQWVLRHPNFQNWKDSGSSNLLWVSADPGCGKSTLSRSLVDEDLKQTDAITCYFFFKDDNDIQQNAATALSAVLHQLFYQKPVLIRHAMSDFAADGDKLSHLFYKLWDILTNAVADPKAGKVYCILDALDECAVGRYDIITALSAFYQQANSKKNASQLKICVTSRPYQDIERRFADLTSNFPTIRLLGEQESDTISGEINLVIRYKVSQLGSELKLNELEQSKLEKELSRINNRTYLWLTLILDIIRTISIPTSRNLEEAIRTIPSTVDNAYEAILARVKEQDQQQALKLLHIMVAATRPLTLKEMNIALAIEDYHRSYKDLNLDDEARFEMSVKNICGLFVTVVDQKIYLIHQTAKEFLIAKSEVNTTTRWKHSLIPMDSETLMARICLTYLLFTELDTASDHKYIMGSHDYLLYAAGSWATHYRKAQKTAKEQMLRLVLRVCDPLSQRFATWFYEYWDVAHIRENYPGFTSPLLVGSYFGHATVVKLLLEARADVESKDRYDRTPLSWAAKNGHEAAVKLLLEARADVESKDNLYSKTPLSWAADNGHEAVVKLLLEARADVDSKNRFGQTPLLLAAKNGHEAVVKLLLEARANVESKDNFYGRTPLSLAAKNRHEAVVKLLLEARADVDSKNRYGQTPLSLMAKNGHEAVVKLLLEARADVESKDNSHSRTPLLLAAENGHEAVVKLLLEARAVVDSRDNFYGETPLSLAAKNGHEAVVKLLQSFNPK